MRSRDYVEFVELLNRAGARYLVVGAHAVAFHARPRATKDLDLFIEPTLANAEKILSVIFQFLGSDLGLSVEDLSTPGRIVQLGVAPSRIDLMAAIAGIRDFGEAWERRVQSPFGEVVANFLSLEDLIDSKVSAGRHQDKADLRALRRKRRRPERDRDSR